VHIPLLEAAQEWACPNCQCRETVRPPLPPNASRFHTCPGLHGLTAPLVVAGTRCAVTAEERQDYLGTEVQARGDDGRQYMAVRTTTDDRDDLLVFAGLAHAELR
jgi:hypothetical protein